VPARFSAVAGVSLRDRNRISDLAFDIQCFPSLGRIRKPGASNENPIAAIDAGSVKPGQRDRPSIGLVPVEKELN